METKLCQDMDIDIYLGTLMSEVYDDLTKRTKGFILSTYKHLKICDGCRKECLDSLRDFSSNEANCKIYPPRSFRLLKENERVLEELVEESG